MNIKPNYFIYTHNYEVINVIDRETGNVYTVKAVGETPSSQEIGDAYAPYGGVGYAATEYNVWRIEETGEEFVYPFSYGHASREYIQSIIDNAKQSTIETIESAKVTAVRFIRPTIDREKKEVVNRVTRALNKTIDRIERRVGYKSAIEMENYVSAWLGFMPQFARFDMIINRHADNSHDVVLESALPELRNLLTEITVENAVL